MHQYIVILYVCFSFVGNWQEYIIIKREGAYPTPLYPSVTAVSQGMTLTTVCGISWLVTQSKIVNLEIMLEFIKHIPLTLNYFKIFERVHNMHTPGTYIPGA